MFTIEVKKKDKDEEFDFKDLELSHKECYGGGVTLRMESTDGLTSVLPLHWEIKVRCKRCSSHVELPASLEQGIKVSIIGTAIDGEERKPAGNLRVVQKT